MNADAKPATPYVKGRIAPSQIKAIHAVIHKLGLDDDTYRDMLRGRYGARSCKDLTWSQAEELLASLNGTGRPHTSQSSHKSQGLKYQGLKYRDLDGRPGFATGSQLRLIDALFNQVTRAVEEETIEKALNSFVCRIAKVAGLRMLKGWQVEKVVKALEAMGAVKKA